MTKQGKRSIMYGGLGVLAGAATMFIVAGAPSQGAAGTVPSTDRAAIEAIVREYILTHPEILPEAMQNLERKEASGRVKQNATALTKPFARAWEGAGSPDVTMVEFFDYACSYCRAARADVERLLAEDPQLRVVYREVPILGPDSEQAARASLGVAKMGGDYGAFHRELFGSGKPNSASIDRAIAAAKVDVRKAREAGNSTEVEAELNANLNLQRALGISGTPSWIVGDQLINGAVGYDELKSAIARARQTR
jgi:protein-disulfide isomerase